MQMGQIFRLLVFRVHCQTVAMTLTILKLSSDENLRFALEANLLNNLCFVPERIEAWIDFNKMKF